MLLEIWRRVRDDLFVDPLTLQNFDWKEALKTAVSTLRNKQRAEFAVVLSDMLGELESLTHTYQSVMMDEGELDRDHRPGFLGADFSEERLSRRLRNPINRERRSVVVSKFWIFIQSKY